MNVKYMQIYRFTFNNQFFSLEDGIKL